MISTDINLYRWIGHKVEINDTIRLQPAHFMQATLDRDATLEEGADLPPLWHWLYFLEATRQSELGRDAHPKKGGFLPPVPLPRRMWAGGRFEFHKGLKIGKPASKISQIKSIVNKKGRFGKLYFVTVLHELYQGGDLCLCEEHDIVYLNDPSPSSPAPKYSKVPQNPEYSRNITPTEVMLFRYSALTFNGHRIHYDSDYARKVEGYDGLVFHGPLTATLLVDLAGEIVGISPKSFSFKGLAPLTNLTPFEIQCRTNGKNIELWAKRADGAIAMNATALF